MSIANDVRFWDRTSRKYALKAVADPQGYERTLARTRELLRSNDSVLELGCGTGSTALRLAGDVRHYLATDISPAMIAIAQQKLIADPHPSLVFRATTAEAIEADAKPFDAVLGFNYLHLVRDLPGTLRHIHALLGPQGLLVSKTPCLGDMSPLLGWILPVVCATGLAPHASVFNAQALRLSLEAAGFEILATENHAAKGNDKRPYIVARKR